MNYELAKKLKDAGFPDSKEWNEHTTLMHGNFFMTDGHGVPTLSKLIKACGEEFLNLERHKGNPFTSDKKQIWWSCCIKDRGTLLTCGKNGEFGFKTPEEAVAKLWLELNKPK